jgi:pSer/pThr/pTyr-binding forkhead associated (FHA) protein
VENFYSEPTRSRVHTRVVVDARLLRLLPGIYRVGRGDDCDVVLDDVSVSRQHARLVVGLDGASVEDLESVNGVYLNGARVTSAAPLKDGDVLIIGNRELGIQIIPHSTLPPPRETLPATTLTPLPPSPRDQARPEPAKAQTARASAIELLAQVAERALAAGNPDQAERAVRTRLLDTLHAASKDPHSIPAEVIARSVALALELARAGCAGRWLEYALELLATVSEPCSEAMAADVRGAAAGGRIDDQALDRYARAMAVHPASLDKSRTVALIEQLRGAG